MKFLKANGIHIGYDSLGNENDEAILLISGLGAQMIRWTTPFCESLADEGFRVVRFDNRDAGLSTHFTDSPVPDFSALANAVAAGRRPDVPYTLDDMAADAIGLLDALSIDRAHVVGRSMGGMIAQLMASDYPQRVLSLTSIMSSTGNPDLPSAAPDVMAMLTKRAPDPIEDENGFVAHGLAFAKRIAGHGFGFDEEAHRAIVLQELRRAYDPAGFARQIGAIAATGDIRSRLAHILAPTLVVHGADDPLILPACGKDTAASIRGAEFLLIDGMGHDLPIALYPTLVKAICRNMSRQSRESVGTGGIRPSP
ncbi:MAG: alpha/beta fold hydrolase [Rudaea sp.]|uniref:alpha/beta fold hydrolase n=1 Tax=unclassified Rudaea TaxID=2627037 RepID=UPI0010F4EAB8|nr:MULTISPECIES: alpha/beta hydrolase [unclassified Rudaea]MBN8885555.1 alpha/beta fold hydrolase [Rudaea sp.]MBR0343974.1 alpha/beta fold hydrolase [Rudaea sp.]